LCPQCQTEMFIDEVKVEGNQETFIYKCKNKQCQNFGYGEETNENE
jgi:hypothetical protein